MRLLSLQFPATAMINDDIEARWSVRPIVKDEFTPQQTSSALIDRYTVIVQVNDEEKFFVQYTERRASPNGGWAEKQCSEIVYMPSKLSCLIVNFYRDFAIKTLPEDATYVASVNDTMWDIRNVEREGRIVRVFNKINRQPQKSTTIAGIYKDRLQAQSQINALNETNKYTVPFSSIEPPLIKNKLWPTITGKDVPKRVPWDKRGVRRLKG